MRGDTTGAYKNLPNQNKGETGPKATQEREKRVLIGGKGGTGKSMERRKWYAQGKKRGKTAIKGINGPFLVGEDKAQKKEKVTNSRELPKVARGQGEGGGT